MQQPPHRTRPWHDWLLLALLSAVLCGCLPSARTPTAPWPTGRTLGDGWTVVRVETHPEYRRLNLRRGTEQAGVEVVANRASPAEWATAEHRVQPLPGQDAPESALRATLAGVRAWEAEAAPDPLVVDAQEADQQMAWWTRVVLTALALVWLASAGLAGWRLGLLRRRSIWVALGVCAACIAGVTWHGPLADSDINVIHETGPIARRVMGQNGTDGPLPEALRSWLPLPHRGQLPIAVFAAAHLALHLACAVLVGWLAWWRTRSLWLVLAFAVAWSVAPSMRLGATSERPTALLAFLAIGTVPAVVLLLRDGARSWVGWLGLGLCAVLVAATRVELIAAPVLLGVAVVAEHAGLRTRIAASLEQPARAKDRWPWALAGLGLLTVQVAGAQPLHLMLDVSARVDWLMAALSPVHPSTGYAVLAPFAGLPPGVLLLAALGSLAALHAALRHHVAWLALPMAVAFCLKAYTIASHHVFYEIVRYDGLVAPWLFLLAVGGAGVVVRTWPGKVAPLLLASMVLVPVQPAIASSVWPSQAGDLPLVGPLDRDRQRDGRFLLEVAHTWPDCVILTRNRTLADQKPTLENLHYARIDRLAQEVRQTPASSGVDHAVQTLDADDQRAGRGKRCVVLVNSLDCNLVGTPSCYADAPHRTADLTRSWPTLPYADPATHARLTDRVTVSAWLLRP